MAEQASRLGRGLSALLGSGVDRDAITAPTQAPTAVEASAGGGFTLLPIDAIAPNPGQPRKRFDEAALDALATSIRERGLLQPVVVRPVEGGAGYEIIAGERRWQASRRAGATEIPAVIRDADARDRLELALVENVVREDLNPMELARGVAALVEDFGRTHESVAGTLGRSRPAISNLLRLLELPDVVQEMVERGELSEGHARAVLGADGAKARRVLAERIVREGLSVRQAEAAARGSAAAPAVAPRVRAEATPGADRVAAILEGAFEHPVAVRRGARGIVIELRFADDDEAALAADRADHRRFT